MKKIPVKKAENKGDCLSLNISSPKKASDGSLHWRLVLDKATYHSWSLFLKQKRNLGTEVMKLIKDSKKKHSFQVRCDSAGKHRSLETMCEQEGPWGSI